MHSPKRLDRVRIALRTRHYSIRTERAYVQWAKRFILFHGKKHPSAMGADEINAFLSHLAVERHVSASTQGQALAALLCSSIKAQTLRRSFALPAKLSCHSTSTVRMSAPGGTKSPMNSETTMSAVSTCGCFAATPRCLLQPFVSSGVRGIRNLSTQPKRQRVSG